MTLAPDRAVDAARRPTTRSRAASSLGPLHGLPIAHKDLALTAGVRTTFGSPIFADHVPDEDELFVERIRAAGAVVVGKTNTPEWGAGSHTFNPVFGATRNPYDLARTGGGSSGGAAAALATRDGADRRRQRPRRLAPQPGGVLQRRRVPPDARPGAVVAVRRSVARPLGRRSDGAHGRRRRAAALGDGRARPARADLDRRSRAQVFPRGSTPMSPACAWRSPPTPTGGCRSSRGSSTSVRRRAGTFEGLGWHVEEAFPDLAGAREASSRSARRRTPRTSARCSPPIGTGSSRRSCGTSSSGCR